MRGKIEKALARIVGDKVQLEHPVDPSHGDYSTNIALILAKKEKKSPLALANELVSKMGDMGELRVEKIEVAPPGFINFWLSRKALLEELKQAVERGGVEGGKAYGASKDGNGRTMVIDYSSPNIAKAFGIGHLRSTIIGQAIYNLYKFQGWKAIGDNHLGDWGTQFGALLYQVTSKKLDPNNLTIDTLEKLYVEFNKELVNNPLLQDEARAWFKKLEEGDKTARKIWEKLKEISLAEFDRIYRILGVKLDFAYGESFYEGELGNVIKECVEKGVAKEDQGALIINYPESLPPAIIRKSDGATTYLTRDLSAIKFRIKEWDPDLIVYEVGAEQELHFRQLFKAVELLGWSNKVRLVHVKHGLYLGENGKKFSTRRGETIHLEDVLEEAIKRAKDVVKEKPGKGDKLSVAEVKKVSKAVGVGAIKYYDLSHHPATNIVFNWEDMFALEGNSGPYLQYTYARTQSVLAKTENGKRKTKDFGDLKINSEEEAILRTFYKFPEVVSEAAQSFSPNILCSFLYDFATKYNRLYNTHRILNAESEEAKNLRLALTKVTGNILKKGLNLLGIGASERM